MTITYAEVIGDPIAHSKSPLIHNFWLAKLGIEGAYRPCLVRQDQLGDYLEARRRDENWRGCNVTMPHKQSVIPYLHDAVAQDPNHLFNRVGSVNCLLSRGGALHGANTDIPGILDTLRGETERLQGREVVVIGSGGAARAAIFAMICARAGRITAFARDLEKAARMMRALHPDPIPVAIASMNSPLPPAALLINATPLGMKRQPPLHLDLAPLPDDAIVYDLVYAPVVTPLLEQAAARGLRTLDGLALLVAQAVTPFTEFFGRAPPRQHDAELRALLTS